MRFRWLLWQSVVNNSEEACCHGHRICLREQEQKMRTRSVGSNILKSAFLKSARTHRSTNQSSRHEILAEQPHVALTIRPKPDQHINEIQL